jgi:hypothetical protein
MPGAAAGGWSINSLVFQGDFHFRIRGAGTRHRTAGPFFGPISAFGPISEQKISVSAGSNPCRKNFWFTLLPAQCNRSLTIGMMRITVPKMACRLPIKICSLLCLIMWCRTAAGQGFSDMFAGRQLLTNVNVVVTGSNNNYTVEPNEPEHADKIGGHSGWISWLAPANGLVTLSTAGSSFDTLLAVYTLPPGTNQSLQRLDEDVSDDDYGGLITSYVQFGVNSNRTYQIAVDGFNGAVGNIILQLNFLSLSNLQPTILSRPGDQALRLGEPLILTINLVSSPNLQFLWFLNGSPVAGQDDDSISPTLVIPSLKSTDLGFYSLKFYLNDDSFFSSSIEVQVNSEGQKGVLARYKMADAAQSGLIGGFMLGYNGTQIFNTTNSIVDTNAPAICGVPPGPAYWFSYKAPASGLMTISTTNSTFPTLLAVFTYSGVLNSYTDLVSVACDNNSGGTGTNTSSVQFLTTAGTTTSSSWEASTAPAALPC